MPVLAFNKIHSDLAPFRRNRTVKETFARTQAYICYNGLHDRVVFAQDGDHPVFNYPGNRIGYLLVGPNRHFYINKNGCRIVVREEQHLGFECSE